MTQKTRLQTTRHAVAKSDAYIKTYKTFKTFGKKLRPGLLLATRWIIFPALLYAVLFFLMQPQYFLHFSDGFYLDAGDGLQNVWNIWWVNHALVDEKISPYFTTILHWPEGVSLVPQTMNIINGLMAIPLMNIFGMSLVEVVNFAVVFAFVFGGITMAWFIQKLFKVYWVAILIGALFTFSSYHFAHAWGHLQLVTLEFIPLFLLAFWTLIEKLKYRYAVLAALSLFLVLLSDYYYLFWCVMVGGLWLVWNLITKRVKLSAHFVKVLGVFAILSTVLIGPLVYKLIHLTKTDPIQGAHNARDFSLDPISVVIPGGSSFFHGLTDWYTTHLQYFAEASVFFGFGLLTLLVIAFVRQFVRKDKRVPRWMNFWWIILIVFGLLSLGPRLHIAGETLEAIPMPYAILEMLFPTLQISGMPMRWILVALVAALVIGASVLSQVDLKKTKGKILIAVFIVVALVDIWPRQLPLTSPDFRPYVSFLKEQPYGAVVDNGARSGSEQLYNQTLHNKPIAFGYVTRTTKSVDDRGFLLFAAIEQGRIDTICKDFKIRYFTIPKERPITTAAPIIYDDGQTLIYDLKNSPEC